MKLLTRSSVSSSVLRKKPPQWALAAVVVIALFGLAPNFVGKYEVDSILDTFLLYVILAESYDILGGLMGYVALGITVFYAAGAYLFAIPYFVLHWNVVEAFVVSTAITALMGFLVSFPMFRLRGFYFAVATLALLPLGGYIVTYPPYTSLTGGVGGISGIVVVSYQDAYYAILAFAIFTVALIFLISKSKFGLALTSIREDEQIAESSGINTRLIKKIAMTISATLCAFAGCLFAWSQGSLVPSSIFSFNIAFIHVTFALFGGTGTIIGPILGSGVYSVIDYVLRSTFIQNSSAFWIAGYESAIIGIFLIVVGLFAPGGLMQLRKPLNKFFFGEPRQKKNNDGAVLPAKVVGEEKQV